MSGRFSLGSIRGDELDVADGRIPREQGDQLRFGRTMNGFRRHLEIEDEAEKMPVARRGTFPSAHISASSAQV